MLEQFLFGYAGCSAPNSASTPAPGAGGASPGRTGSAMPSCDQLQIMVQGYDDLLALRREEGVTARATIRATRTALVKHRAALKRLRANIHHGCTDAVGVCFSDDCENLTDRLADVDAIIARTL